VAILDGSLSAAPVITPGPKISFFVIVVEAFFIEINALRNKKKKLTMVLGRKRKNVVRETRKKNAVSSSKKGYERENFPLLFVLSSSHIILSFLFCNSGK
jgi:hypothetical protein